MNTLNEINEIFKLNNINKKSLNKYLIYIYDDLNNRVEIRTKNKEGISKESIKLFFKFHLYYLIEFIILSLNVTII